MGPFGKGKSKAKAGYNSNKDGGGGEVPVEKNPSKGKAESSKGGGLWSHPSSNSSTRRKPSSTSSPSRKPAKSPNNGAKAIPESYSNEETTPPEKSEEESGGDLSMSSLTRYLGLNRIKTRSGPLSEDGSDPCKASEAQSRSSPPEPALSHPTTSTKDGKNHLPPPAVKSSSLFQSLRHSKSTGGGGKGGLAEYRNNPPPPSCSSSSPHSSLKGSVSLPESGTPSQPNKGDTRRSSVGYSAAQKIDGAPIEAKDSYQNFPKTDYMLEKKVRSRFASYLNSDSGKSSDTESPRYLDVIKETESARFQGALPKSDTLKKKKWPKDIKSFSHELGSKRGRHHGYSRPHSDNDLKKLLSALQARFETAKDEVDVELHVFAADLVEILDKNDHSFLEWRLKVEDLLVLARDCAVMNSDEFRIRCEGIVQVLDDSRQLLPMGLLKQLHTRMLFILTRCTRLLQFQKETSSLDEEEPFLTIKQCLRGVPNLERTWKSAVSKKGRASLHNRKLRPDSSDLNSRSESPFLSGRLSKPAGKITIEEPLQTNPLKLSTPEDVGYAMSKKMDASDILYQGFSLKPQEKALQKSSHWDPLLGAEKKDYTDTIPPPPVKRMSWGYWSQDQDAIEELETVICRICEKVVPTAILEAHSLICALADTCDLQGHVPDEKLRMLAESMEKLIELNTPKSSHLAMGDSPDASKFSRGSANDGFDGNSPRQGGDVHGRGYGSRFDDLCPADGTMIEEPRLINFWNFKPHLGPKSEQGGVTSSSAGSVTPRSTLTTPRTSQLDLLWAERGSLAELDDYDQVNELIDIARCIADNCPKGEGESEYLIACMQDLDDVLNRNKQKALTVDIFGRHIENLLKEKYTAIIEAGEQRKYDSPNSVFEDDGTSTDDGFQSLKSTPTHPSCKDRIRIEDFEILKPISRGAFGRVFLARKRITGDLFAIKVLRKIDMIRKNAVENILAERDILISVSNPFVVRFFYSFTCSDNLYLVMEYLNGGDLYSLLSHMGCLEEHVAKVYIAELVLALEYLHSSGVVHRDLKPDNILIAHDGHIKLTDFGLSKVGLINSTDDFGPIASSFLMNNGKVDRVATESTLPATGKAEKRSAVGTPDYLAPEILLGTEHGSTADWWSTGVILFECLIGMPPFNAHHPQVIFDNILNRKIPWPQMSDNMSDEARDLVDRLLTEDPKRRLGFNGASEVKAHPFFTDINWDTLARQKAAFVPTPESLEDTSYFTSRHSEGHSHVTPEFGDSSDCSSSCASLNSVKAALEEGDDEGGDPSEYESSPSVQYNFENFSFKNLTQLASINYYLLSQTGKESSRTHSRQPSSS